MKSTEIGPTVLLSCGAVFNILLIICLHRTWRYWNQLKWYILMLAVGNCLEVLFTLTYLLGSTFKRSWLGGDVSCKFLMFMEPLGPSVANMALAAASIHVLLTAITGSHGSKLRHVLVLGLFVVLSLPLPVSKIPVFGVMTDKSSDTVLTICTDLEFFHHTAPHYRFYYFVAGSIALVFFPLILIVGSVGGAAMILCFASPDDTQKRRTQDERTDRVNGECQEIAGGVNNTDSKSANVTLIAILGTVLMLLCVPLHAFIIFFRYKSSSDTVTVYLILVYVFYSKVSVTAVICAVFACAYVYRKGRQQQTQVPRAASERTKLVH